MCGRISLSTPPEELVDELGLDELPLDYTPRWNVAPSQQILALVADDAGRLRATRFKWGLVPFWAKDPSIGNRMINARAETVTEKPAFRNALNKRRCLIVVDGFYEWRKQGDGRTKVPMRVCLQTRRPFTLAGLWEEWSKSGSPLRSCTILTTGCNELMRPIHERMPVIVPAEGRARWLDTATTGDALQALLRPYASDDLAAYAVSTLVNSPANDMAECFDRVEEVEEEGTAEVGGADGERSTA